MCEFCLNRIQVISIDFYYKFYYFNKLNLIFLSGYGHIGNMTINDQRSLAVSGLPDVQSEMSVLCPVLALWLFPRGLGKVLACQRHFDQGD